MDTPIAANQDSAAESTLSKVVDPALVLDTQIQTTQEDSQAAT